jgi:hypothetical protein
MKNRKNVLIGILVLILASIACGGNSVPEMATRTPAPNTATPQPTITPLANPMSTFAPLPFTIQAPTVTFTPLPPTADVDVSDPMQISFAEGATSASVVGGVNPFEIVTYSFYVVGNQPAQISLQSQGRLIMSIYDGAKRVVLSPNNQANSWQGYFQKGGVYYINIHGDNADVSKFTLSMLIAARLTLGAESKEVRFKANTVGGSIISYAIAGKKDQTLVVKVSSPSGNVALTIWGFVDGQPYARAAAGTTDFSLLLPATQDYIIDVVPSEGASTNYVLHVSLQ